MSFGKQEVDDKDAGKKQKPKQKTLKEAVRTRFQGHLTILRTFEAVRQNLMIRLKLHVFHLQ